ncbi:MAG: GntR family transcriptional regulator [Ruthenibacterium sp.]
MEKHSSDYSRLGGNVMSSKVSSLMIEAIEHGVYQNAVRLPAEVDLAHEFEVSRSVIRDSLSNLARAGIIERVRGVGTLINHDALKTGNRLDLKCEYATLIQNAGLHPNTDSLQIYSILCTEALAQRLHLDENAEVLVCEKRILADKRPVIYSIDYISIEALGKTDYHNLDWSRSIFEVLEQHFGIQIISHITRLKPFYGDAILRSRLCVGEQEALLLMDEVSYNDLCVPILCSQSYYTDFFEFSLLRKSLLKKSY